MYERLAGERVGPGDARRDECLAVDDGHGGPPNSRVVLDTEEIGEWQLVDAMDNEVKCFRVGTLVFDEVASTIGSLTMTKTSNQSGSPSCAVS